MKKELLKLKKIIVRDFNFRKLDIYDKACIISLVLLLLSSLLNSLFLADNKFNLLFWIFFALGMIAYIGLNVRGILLGKKYKHLYFIYFLVALIIINFLVVLIGPLSYSFKEFHTVLVGPYFLLISCIEVVFNFFRNKRYLYKNKLDFAFIILIPVCGYLIAIALKTIMMCNVLN